MSRRYGSSSSAILAATAASISCWCSWVMHRAMRMLSSTAPPSRPYRFSAISATRSGRKAFSVSRMMTFPAAPPCSLLSCAVTAMVAHSCVFPVRNSPNTSVTEPVSTPPPSTASSSFDPVVMCRRALDSISASVPLTNPVFFSRRHASMICAAGGTGG
jgi:hypothetical protein